MNLNGTKQYKSMLKIKAFPRIHITLIGMNKDGYRLNGGIGFSISSPILDISFETSNTIDVIDKRKYGFTGDELNRLKSHINQVAKNQDVKKVVIGVINEGIIQSHVGFGSNTMIYLACVEALFILNQRDYSDKNVIALSGRGGTSGIGINTYFKGGYVFDTGIKNHEQRTLAPSSTFISSGCQQPLLIKSIELPLWDLGICIPQIVPKTEEEEKRFFQTNCPIEKSDVEKILYEVVYGVTSSLLENDFKAFCESINAIQQTKWKSLERNLYGETIIEAEKTIRKNGARCVGMSSLGPMLYFFGDDIEGSVEKVNREMSQCVCFKTTFNNLSRIVEND